MSQLVKYLPYNCEAQTWISGTRRSWVWLCAYDPRAGEKETTGCQCWLLTTLVKQVNSRLMGDPVLKAKWEAWRDGSAVKLVPALPEDPSSVRSTT